jgi:hypothetical protein
VRRVDGHRCRLDVVILPLGPGLFGAGWLVGMAFLGRRGVAVIGGGHEFIVDPKPRPFALRGSQAGDEWVCERLLGVVIGISG